MVPTCEYSLRFLNTKPEEAPPASLIGQMAGNFGRSLYGFISHQYRSLEA